MNMEVPPAHPLPPKTCPFAIVSLVVGIGSFCLPVLGSIAAIAFGFVSLSRIRSSRGALNGRGMAITGIVLGCVSLVMFFFSMLAIVFLSRPMAR